MTVEGVRVTLKEPKGERVIELMSPVQIRAFIAGRQTGICFWEIWYVPVPIGGSLEMEYVNERA